MKTYCCDFCAKPLLDGECIPGVGNFDFCLICAQGVLEELEKAGMLKSVYFCKLCNGTGRDRNNTYKFCPESGLGFLRRALKTAVAANDAPDKQPDGEEDTE